MTKKSALDFACICGILLIVIVLAVGALHSGIRQEDIEEAQAPSASLTEEYTEQDPNETSESAPQGDASDWKLLLVNSWNELPDDFTVELKRLNGGHAIDERAYPDLQAMMDDARAEGLSPVICSSYRTEKTQEALYENKVNRLLAKGYSQKDAETEAGKWVAVPGTSEHQAGLALDIVAESYRVLDEEQEKTAEQMWLMENAYKYGFILRYPREKSDITGIYYEPWHYRYVGKEAAIEIYKKGLCLEEYLEILDAGG